MARKCPDCGNENRSKIKEKDNKDKVLYYGMQGSPVFAKKFVCGLCSKEWDASE